MKKNSIGQTFINQYPDKKLEFEGNFVNFLDNPIINEDGMLIAIRINGSFRKKDRKKVRYFKRYHKFIRTQCQNCISYNKGYCEDLELKVEDFTWYSNKCGWLVKR